MDYNLIPQVDWDAGGYAVGSDGGWEKFNDKVKAYCRKTGQDGSWHRKKRHGNTRTTTQRPSKSSQT
jgi:hypothetical protein